MKADGVVERVARKWAEYAGEGWDEDHYSRDVRFFARALVEEIGVTREMVEALTYKVEGVDHIARGNRPAYHALSLLLDIAEGGDG